MEMLVKNGTEALITNNSIRKVLSSFVPVTITVARHLNNEEYNRPL